MKIPGYKLISKLGQGGMASVYLALQESLDREVALKIMDPKMASDESFCDRFLKEGKIVAQLSSHPDIVTVYDIGRAGDYYYMAMEYIAGPNLKDRIYKGDNPKQPLLVIRQVASALQMAHSRGFIHRDVKPANILFKESGDAVLSDFGIAKAVQADTQLTAIGYAVGTPEYMSPEQAMGQAVDFRADLYCLGVVLYEMLAEKKPYVGQDPFSTALMHINNPVPRLPEKVGDLQPLIDRLMAKDREQRYQSAQEVIDAIDRYMGATRATAAVAEIPQATEAGKISSKKDSLPKSPKPLYLGIGFGLLLIGAGLAFAFRGQFLPATAPASMSSSEAPVPNSRPLSEDEQQTVARLLEAADAHMSIGRLKEPPGSNALETYRMVLELDPSNSTARQAIKTIESR
ncbi:MAG: protein kinase [Gammaproteobacteria bacterium]|nr:protein kinase [Gammaproteobacteria bacterium]